jgi:hypothetical protein
LRRLLEAAVTISSDLELQLVLRRVIEAAVELVDARYGALGVLDESRELSMKTRPDGGTRLAWRLPLLAPS